MSTRSSLSRPDVWFTSLLIFDVIAGLAMVAVLWAGLLYAGDAVNLSGVEQVAQRIFYFHIGSNIAALHGVPWITGRQRIGYLVSRRSGVGSLGGGQCRDWHDLRDIGAYFRCDLGQASLEYILDMGSPSDDSDDHRPDLHRLHAVPERFR